jgi:PPP family 3-phenylpropionic acid transporter
LSVVGSTGPVESVYLTGDSEPISARTRSLAGLWPRAFYAARFAAAASLSPFLVLRYQALGLSGEQIGVLTGLSPLITLVGASFWGALADAARQHQRMFRLSISAVMACAVLLALARQFWMLLPVIALFAFCGTPITPLMDNSVLEWLGDHRERYGKVRLWGAVGWGVAAPVVGRLAERFGLDMSFYGYLFFMALALLVSLKLPIARASIGRKWGQGLRSIVQDGRWLQFLFVALMGGIALAVVQNYLFLYMDHLGARSSVMGLALSVATLGEVVVFWLSERMVRWLGRRGLLLLALAALAVRVMAYSLIRVPWLVLPVQLLHGLCFSAMWVASVGLANEIAPEGMGATAQGLLTSVFFGLGGAIGGLGGGIVYDRLGFAVVFRLAAVFAMLGMAVFALGSGGLVQGRRP